MNKRIKYLSIFLIASLFFVGNVSAKNFTCELGNYKLTYNTSGKLVSATDLKGNAVKQKNLEDYAKPKSSKDCPKNDKYEVRIADGKRTLIVGKKTFDCKVDNYKLTYNTSGKLVSANYPNGDNVPKDLLSNVEPKSSKDCPTSDKYKVSIINAGRTLIVAGKNEKIYDNNSMNNDNINNSNNTTSCGELTDESSCTSNDNVKCVWNSQYKLCSVDGNAYLSCGDAKDIPPIVPELISYAVNLLKIVTPIILIIVGIIELVKAVASTNEDSMKKAQSKLIKKVVAAVMVFFVITIVQFVTLKVADSSESGSIKSCLKCFLNGTEDCGSIYVKDGYGQCYFKNGNSKECSKIAE